MGDLPDIKMTISVYDSEDHEIGQYTETFNNLLSMIPNYKDYYYRITVLGKHDIQGKVKSQHFNTSVSNFGGFYLSAESFLNNYLNYCIQHYRTKLHGNFSFSYILCHYFWYEDRMKTLDQNIHHAFVQTMNDFLKQFPSFVEIDDLNTLKGTSGVYLLVLDEYNVCYFGISTDMERRIKQHWSINSYYTGSGIDMFKTFDTTRVYACPHPENKMGKLEQRVIKKFPSRYTLNIMAGGDMMDLLNDLFTKGTPITKEIEQTPSFIYYPLLPYDHTERINLTKNKFIRENSD